VIRIRTLHLLLLDSELELVPKEHWSHPCVVTNAKRRGKRPSQVLLDSSFHHPLFKDPKERSRRGRPDIVHQFLLMGLDSLLNIEGKLRLWVHTRDDRLITVSPRTRLPKNYGRYQGLFEELLISGAVPSKDDPLLLVRGGSNGRKCVEEIRKDSLSRDMELITFLMHDSGERMDAPVLFREALSSQECDVLCIIGGFSEGDYRSDVPFDRKVSIHSELLKVWAVEMELLSAFRWASEETGLLKDHEVLGR